MRIKHIKYYENKGQPNYWQVSDISLQQTNLIIGINSTGKTRLLSVIGSFAKIIAQKARMNGHFKVEFSNKLRNHKFLNFVGAFSNFDWIKNSYLKDLTSLEK